MSTAAIQASIADCRSACGSGEVAGVRDDIVHNLEVVGDEEATCGFSAMMVASL